MFFEVSGSSTSSCSSENVGYDYAAEFKEEEDIEDNFQFPDIHEYRPEFEEYCMSLDGKAQEMVQDEWIIPTSVSPSKSIPIDSSSYTLSSDELEAEENYLFDVEQANYKEYEMFSRIVFSRRHKLLQKNDERNEQSCYSQTVADRMKSESRKSKADKENLKSLLKSCDTVCAQQDSLLQLQHNVIQYCDPFSGDVTYQKTYSEPLPTDCTPKTSNSSVSTQVPPPVLPNLQLYLNNFNFTDQEEPLSIMPRATDFDHIFKFDLTLPTMIETDVAIAEMDDCIFQLDL